MIRPISRTPDKIFGISGAGSPESAKEPCEVRHEVLPAVGAGIHPAPASEVKVDAHEYFARLGDYFIAKFGGRLATVKAQMVFDACGPGRDIDPQTLFTDDSDGDSWVEAITSLNF